MNENKFYNDYGTWIRKKFPFHVQKLSIDAGFSCPNIDGTINIGGCTYCNNKSFNPSYCNKHDSITKQLETGKDFFSGKYPEMKYLAYFQSHSNTYGNVEKLRNIYEEALSVKDVVGIVIATRPDCISDEILNYLEELNKKTFLIVEYGIESTNDKTLQLINRGHSFECCRKAIEDTSKSGIITCGHVILGLPGESPDDIIKQASTISALKLNILKIHQMQIIKGTKLSIEYNKNPFHIFSVDEYISLIAEYIQYLRKDLILERFVSQSEKDLLIAPNWGLKNYEFTNLLVNYLKQKGIYQGSKII
jgi:radical SAM protein (TIGR01212 family)